MCWNLKRGKPARRAVGVYTRGRLSEPCSLLIPLEFSSAGLRYKLLLLHHRTNSSSHHMATPLTISAVAVPDTRDNIGILGKMEGCIAALSKYQISKFFAQHAPTTQEACNQEAEQCIGGSVHPAPVQGATSYTVVADDDAAGGFVVQFRADDFALDLGFLARVEQAYRPLHAAPTNTSASKVGSMSTR